MNLTVQVLLLIAAVLFGCGTEVSETTDGSEAKIQADSVEITEEFRKFNPQERTLSKRINVPLGYQRTKAEDRSFPTYLRELPLKPHGAEVRYFNGAIKPNNDIYDAVIDLGIGTRDLHQCADAIMRLKAEHLWNERRYEEIHFNFTNDFRVDYAEWMSGKRMIIEGNKTYWQQRAAPSNTYADFWKYMELIFAYAGTLSLNKEMQTVPVRTAQIGDVFIQGGSPGHAVIIVDRALDTATGEQVFLLAQSYMPAQEIQVLKNPNNETLSPWYVLDVEGKLITPEWTFDAGDLKRFE